MALEKVNYVSEETVISAENLNQIQDEIIRNGQQIEALKGQVATLVNAQVE